MTAVAPERSGGQVHKRAGRAEREARARIAPQAGTIKGHVLRMLVDAGEVGVTAWEAWQKYNRKTGEQRSLYSIAPRLSELAFDGYAEQSGSYRRPSPAEPRREVYVATHSGRVWVEQRKAAGDLS